jgi:hypothetical protein
MADSRARQVQVPLVAVAPSLAQVVTLVRTRIWVEVLA